MIQKMLKIITRVQVRRELVGIHEERVCDRIRLTNTVIIIFRVYRQRLFTACRIVRSRLL